MRVNLARIFAINIFFQFLLLIVSFSLYTYMTTHAHTLLLFRTAFLLKRSIKIKIVSYNKTAINNTNNAAVNSGMTWKKRCFRVTIQKVLDSLSFSRLFGPVLFGLKNDRIVITILVLPKRCP